jgi:hypothetical protein
MTEIGSDERFEQVADTSAINRLARLDRARRILEEWNVMRAPLLADPGTDHPALDEPPPPGVPHPVFDTRPPA